MTDTNLHENSPVSVTIGATTYTSIVSTAINFQGVDGGPAIKARTVGNTTAPVGWTDLHKDCEVAVVLDADVMPALITASYWNVSGSNTALSAFVITEKNMAGQTRTVTFTAANTKIKKPTPKNIFEGDQHIELLIGTYGTVTYSGWA
jgi:hypothetical protein